MVKYRVRRLRQGGDDFHEMIGPVPRTGDRIFVDDAVFLVRDIIWTPSSVDDTVAEVTVTD